MAKRLSKEVWERRINDAGAGGYEFVRWAVDDKFGSNHKCVAVCVKDGHVWESKVNNLVDSRQGCPHCAGVRRWKAEERIEQINGLENIEFVSWVDSYKNSNSKANVKCKVDGFEWSSEVDNLVNCGRGCPQCAGKRRWTPDERIEQINEIKNIEFVSWVGGYKNHSSKANVRCTIDNFEWSSRVKDLVNKGTGCPKCAKHGYDQSKTGYLYALRSECGRYVKVGISNETKRRHKELERSTPFKFNLVEQIPGDGDKIRDLEKRFHQIYKSAGFVEFQGCTEWLICTPELLEELRNLGDK